MKKFIYIFLILPLSLDAQIRFNHQIDLEFPFHVITSVLPTDSCYYATGVITDTSDQFFTIGNIFIKFDLKGEVLFYKKLTAQGKFYETWWGDLSYSPNGLVEIGTTKDSMTRALILVYNESGDTLLSKEILHPMFEIDKNTLFYTSELRLDDDGNFYILCRVDSDSLQNAKDICVLKLSPSFEVIGNFSYGSAGADIPLAMIFDNEENLIIGSLKTNKEQTTLNHYSRTHIFSINKNGELLWEYLTPAGQLFNVADDLIEISDGSLIVASGKGIQYQINSESSQIRWNSYIFKLNKNNQLEWGIELRGTRHSSSTGFEKIVTASNGSGYVATGRLIEDKSIGEEVFGSWVVKVSPEGDSLWARYYSVFDSIKCQPNPYDLKTTPDGGYIIVGETRPELSTMTVQRAWIMKLDEHGCLIPGCEANDTINSGIDLPIDTPVHLAIYPNPATDYLNFQLRTARPVKQVQFRILGADGRVIREYSSNHAKDTFIVPVSGWAVGAYFLQYLEKGEVRCSEQFVKN